MMAAFIRSDGVSAGTPREWANAASSPRIATPIVRRP